MPRNVASVTFALKQSENFQTLWFYAFYFIFQKNWSATTHQQHSLSCHDAFVI